MGSHGVPQGALTRQETQTGSPVSLGTDEFQGNLNAGNAFATPDVQPSPVSIPQADLDPTLQTGRTSSTGGVTQVAPTAAVASIADQIGGLEIGGETVTAPTIAPTTVGAPAIGQAAQVDPITGLPSTQVATGTLQQQLEQSLLSPEFGPTSASEEAFLSSIMSQTQGQTAARGLGPATQGALAQDLAPALMGLRQQRIENLQAGAAQQLQQNLAQAGITSQEGQAQFQADLTTALTNAGFAQDITKTAFGGELQTALAQAGITSGENMSNAANAIQAAIASGQLSQNADATQIQAFLAEAGLLQPTIIVEGQTQEPSDLETALGVVQLGAGIKGLAG